MAKKTPKKSAAKASKGAKKAAKPKTAKTASAPAATARPQPRPKERFQALVVEQRDGGLAAAIREIGQQDIRAHAQQGADVTVRVLYSCVNFKDGLAIAGLNKVVRTYPHVPGVDLVGVVEESETTEFAPGDLVIGGGFRVGEHYWGGYSEYVRLRSDQLVPLPAGLTPRRAMAIGAAGLTAMLAVMALEDHGIVPGGGKVLVTGAAGGLGSVAVAVLAHLGYTVVASTGRQETHAYLRELGAGEFVDRAELAEVPTKPLLPERWAAAIDAVGGNTLSNILASLKAGGSVAATGNVAGHVFPASVLPFILRGVNLLGIQITNCPVDRKAQAWRRLLTDLPPAILDSMTTEVPLAAVPEVARKILKGGVRGRVVVDISG